MNFICKNGISASVFLLFLLLSGCGGSTLDGEKTPVATGPTVSAISPANNATGVAANAAIIAAFSVPIDASTASPTTFFLNNGVTGSVTSNGTIATFTPSITLANSTRYTATITTGVKSADGTAMASPYTWTFTTGTTLDTTPPTVTGTYPVSGAIGVATNTAITATFSEPMTASTLTSATFTLNNGVTGTVNFSGTTATFTPSSALANGTTYIATISTGVRDAAGNAMTSARTWTFTTSSAVDSIPPTVSLTNPATGATGVSVNAAITATFSEPMRASTLTNVTFTLNNGVTGTVNPSGTTATFTPSSALASGTTYTATISTGVRDLAGNALASPKSWSFTTAGATIPTVVISPKTATVTQGTTRQFSATVGGTTNAAVTWSATGGSIATNGLYTAPGTSGTYSVTVTTQATPAASDTATVTVVAAGAYLTPGNVTGDVVVAMDSHTTSPISPFIYGLNVADQNGIDHPYSTWGEYMPKFTFNRHGGNNTTPLNWETGYTNAGFDWQYMNYDYPLQSAGGAAGRMPVGPGNAVTPRINYSHARNAAQLVTVPIIGFVARDASGAQPMPVAPNATTPATPDPLHWLQALPLNPAGATTAPNVNDGFVYTDDFVKWMDAKYPNAKTDPVKTIHYQLDNEPDLWFDTHPEIRGETNGTGTGVRTGFDELVDKTAAHAKAVKSVVPNAVVWGGGLALFDAMNDIRKQGVSPAGYVYYFDYFLEKMKQQSDAAGKRLMDVFDMHWYPQGGGILNNYATQNAQAINDREQEPRSLWDPYYIENSWVADTMPAADSSNCNSNGRCPIKLIPRMQARINMFNPGTKIAIGEYSFGRGGDISAAIANADALGIFGKFGVYAATMWPLGNVWAYNVPANNCPGESCATTHARRCELLAIDIYRNYDGNDAKFGDTFIDTAIADATITNRATQNERVTAYASMDAGNPNRVVMVAINKASTALNTGLKITHTTAFSTAEVWQVTGVNGDPGGCTTPTRQADITLPQTNAFNANLPAQSVTVFVLK